MTHFSIHFRRDIILVLATLAALAIIASAAAALEPEGDKNLGFAYAKKFCADCHSIEAGATSSLVIDAVPFTKIAKSPRLTVKDLNGWLTQSHQSMHGLDVPPESRANLIAYIKSLALK